MTLSPSYKVCSTAVGGWWLGSRTSSDLQLNLSSLHWIRENETNAHTHTNRAHVVRLWCGPPVEISFRCATFPGIQMVSCMASGTTSNLTCIFNRISDMLCSSCRSSQSGSDQNRLGHCAKRLHQSLQTRILHHVSRISVDTRSCRPRLHVLQPFGSKITCLTQN